MTDTDSKWLRAEETSPVVSGRYLAIVHEWSDGKYLPKYDENRMRILHFQKSGNTGFWNYAKNIDSKAENDIHREITHWMELPPMPKM